jgi:hypothetical protein
LIETFTVTILQPLTLWRALMRSTPLSADPDNYTHTLIHLLFQVSIPQCTKLFLKMTAFWDIAQSGVVDMDWPRQLPWWWTQCTSEISVYFTTLHSAISQDAVRLHACAMRTWNLTKILPLPPVLSYRLS